MTANQFGQPIRYSSGFKHQIADLALDIEVAVGLYGCAAFAFDTGRPEKASMATALAKAHLTEVHGSA